ncbi:hypothetical protein ACP70R_001602 [Stipagrostis hirtigluma subsp. patula]
MPVIVAVVALVLLLSPLAAAQPWQYCGSSAKYSPNSAYQVNLDAVAAALPRNASSPPALFAKAAQGAGPADNRIFALTLCRGDFDAATCLDCVAGAFRYARRSCPYDKEVAVLYDACFLYFSGEDFLGTTANVGQISLSNTQNVTDADGPAGALFTRRLRELLDGAARWADFFIFDVTRARLLTWKKRLHIIEGIAQGLLYLHKLSRLRIIHRDLKASNILLDNDMNPKISDFRLAKIFSSDAIQGNTNRVVGTYGYMSPEYASDGVFSVKTDVFSFGVLLLEIISGRRNAGFHHQGAFFNLLGYAWKLWTEGRWFELVDASIEIEDNQDQTLEILKCINIALMCVQESAADRPTMSDVVAMLSMETMSSLPHPKQPAYFNVSRTDRELSTTELCSANAVRVSIVEGR